MTKGASLFLGGVLLGAVVCGVVVTSLKAQQSPHIVTQRVYDSTSWELRSQHLVFGAPKAIDTRYNFTPPGEKNEVPGISVLVREGFVDGYSDRFKAPLWVSVHWTRELLEQSEQTQDVKRDFEEDTELPEYARGTNRYNNSMYQRGHMARNKDNLAWGEDNTLMGDLMSNIVPQRAHLNEHVWARLENEHRKIVASDSIHEIWVISGSIYDGLKPIETIGNGIGVPQATYKVIGWFSSDGRFEAQGFVFPQDATDTHPEHYFASIRSIEERTGLDFFPKLSPEESERIETATPRVLWEESP